MPMFPFCLYCHVLHHLLFFMVLSCCSLLLLTRLIKDMGPLASQKSSIAILLEIWYISVHLDLFLVVQQIWNEVFDSILNIMKLLSLSKFTKHCFICWKQDFSNIYRVSTNLLPKIFFKFSILHFLWRERLARVQKQPMHTAK